MKKLVAFISLLIAVVGCVLTLLLWASLSGADKIWMPIPVGFCYFLVISGASLIIINHVLKNDFVRLVVFAIPVIFLVWYQTSYLDLSHYKFILPQNFSGPFIVLYENEMGEDPEFEDGALVLKIPSHGLLKTKFAKKRDFLFGRGKSLGSIKEFYYETKRGPIKLLTTNNSRTPAVPIARNAKVFNDTLRLNGLLGQPNIEYYYLSTPQTRNGEELDQSFFARPTGGVYVKIRQMLKEGEE